MRGRPRPGLTSLVTDADEGSATLILTPAEGFTITGEREEGLYSLDVVRKAPPAPAPTTAVEVPAGDAPKGDAKEPRKEAATKDPAGKDPAGKDTAAPDAVRGQDRSPARAPAPTAADAAPTRPPGSGLVFPFERLPPAALFERGGIAVLAFETADAVTVPPSGASGLSPLGQPRRFGSLTVLRFAVPAGRLLDLNAVAAPGGPAWELSAGESLRPSTTLEPARRPNPSGQVAVVVALPRPGATGWIDLDGERIAVVPSAALEPAGNPKTRRFVDFEILPSRHGLAILAAADDLAVRPDLDGVFIAREGALRPPMRPRSRRPSSTCPAPWPSTGRPGRRLASATCARPCAAFSTRRRWARRSSGAPRGSPWPAPPSRPASTWRA
ncbi:hypothetical protein ACFQFG_04190 [Methylobacterium persicinum]